MSAQTEIIQIREVLFNQAQDAARMDQAFSGVKSIVGDLAVGFMLPFSAALVLFLVAALFYHPRLTRGALWLPAFGLFGGSPKLYSHTRPASFLGVFLSSRKRKGATRVFRKTS